MGGLLTINVEEARGTIATSADLDQLAVVMGCASIAQDPGKELSPFFLSASAAIANRGIGDAVNTLCQCIEQRLRNGSAPKRPMAMYTVLDTNVGTYGTLDDDGEANGTTTIANDSGLDPLITTDWAGVRVVDDGNEGGGTNVGSDGILYQWTLDGGTTWSKTLRLGTDTTIEIPDVGIGWTLTGGNLVTDDTWRTRTYGPTPDTTDVDDAFVALAMASLDFTLIFLDFPVDSDMADHVTTGLDVLLAQGKRVTAVYRTRIPDAEMSESDADWNASIAADFFDFSDSRQVAAARYGVVTDAVTTRHYFRSTFQQFCADIVRVKRAEWPSAPADPLTGASGIPNVTLRDEVTGATIGHDEGPRGASTGLSDPTLGNRFACEQREPIPQIRESVFNCVPWVLYAADEKIKTLMARRLANAIERETVLAALPNLGGRLFYEPIGNGATGTLTEASRNLVHGTIYQALSTEFASELGNADDANTETGLVQVSPSVTVNGGILTLSVVVAPLFPGFVGTINVTLAVKG